MKQNTDAHIVRDAAEEETVKKIRTPADCNKNERKEKWREEIRRSLTRIDADECKDENKKKKRDEPCGDRKAERNTRIAEEWQVIRAHAIFCDKINQCHRDACHQEKNPCICARGFS